MKTVEVTFNAYGSFQSANTYSYTVEDSTEISVGDHAVVHNGEEFKIVKVLNVKAKASAKATKTLVAVLNSKVLEDYEALNTQLKEQKTLFDRLDILLKQESENNKYRMLAASNTEAADILAKLGIN